MENAQRTSDHSLTITDRPPAGTADRTEREGVIRDLYALAGFYVANPDHPLPRSISVHHYVDTPDEVAAMADRHGAGVVYGDGDVRQTDFCLPHTSVTVSLAVRYDGKDRSAW